MNRIFFILVAAGVPLSVIGSLVHWPAAILFTIYCITIIALASYMGRATESLAIIAGPRIGGLLNATFGNAVELIISIFALKEGLTGIVLASLTGSVLGNLLLVAGLSFFVGGLKYKRQVFNIHDARHNSGLLVFAVIVAFVIPEIFSIGMGHTSKLNLSVGISVIMILLYVAALYFKLVTHRGVYQPKNETAKPEEEEQPEWSLKAATAVLFAATIVVAYISENLVHTFHSVAAQFGWSELLSGSLSSPLSETRRSTRLLLLWPIKIKWTWLLKLRSAPHCRLRCLLHRYSSSVRCFSRQACRSSLRCRSSSRWYRRCC